MSVPNAVRRRVREAARNRCGYCQVSAEFIYALMEIDHIIPKAAGGIDDELNLWWACSRCNTFKGDQTHGFDPETGTRLALYNPRQQKWSQHFAWDAADRATIFGQTPCGRATVAALNLNNENAVQFRRLLVSVGWHPPSE